MLYIYKASAGSGKTFTLTYRYIKLLLGVKRPDGTYALAPRDNENHRHILAVTFTNKATEEMKSRIIHELAVLGDMETGWKKKSDYLDMLVADFGCSPEEVRQAAADALLKLLFDFTYFQVSTIDSFFQTILRTFAHDLDLNGNYEVNIDNTYIIAQAVRELLDSLRYSPDDAENRRIASWIWQYIESRFSSGSATNLFNRDSNIYSSIVKLIDKLSNDQFTLHHDRMMDFIGRRLQDVLVKELDRVAGEFLASADSAVNKVLGHIASNRYDGSVKKRGKVKANFTNLLESFLEKHKCDLESKTYMSMSGDHSGLFGKDLLATLEAAPDPEFDRLIGEAAAALGSAVSQTRLIEIIKSNLFVLGIMESVYRHIEDYHSDNNTMLLSDASGMLRSILTDGNVPFVFDRVGVWLDHFLIDEFQDTSQLQWENIRPLLSEAQASDHDSLIIGDEKQCIYRFRFSDPTLLQRKVADTFSANAVIQGLRPEENTNWRSSADVVRFNNDLFATLSRNLGLRGVYSTVNQLVAKKNADTRGYIEANIIDDDSGRSGKALAIMLANIDRQIGSGYCGSDICILTRDNTEGTAVIEYLQDHLADYPSLGHLRIISDDAMLVASSPAVRIILSVMRQVAMTKTEESEAAGILSRKRDELIAMVNRYNYISGNKEGVDPETALREAIDSGKDAAPQMDLDLENMVCYSVPSLVERIIRRYISPAVAQEQNMFISAFQDLVLEYFEFGAGDLRSFLTWWDDNKRKCTVSSASDRDAIRVMTIHKSKGLEFDCVHIPFADWQMVKFRDKEWFDTSAITGIDPDALPPLLPLQPGKYMRGTWFDAQYRARRDEQLLDELNVLYVAFTRAKSELIVSMNATDAGTEAFESDALRVNQLLVPVLPSLPGCAEAEVGSCSADDVAVRTFSWGVHTVADEEEEKQTATLDPDGTLIMPSYFTEDREDLWRQVDIEEDEKRTPAQERGIMLHNVLAYVRVPADIHKAVHRLANRGMMSRDVKEEVESFMQDQLRRPEIAPWFAPDCMVARERKFHIPGQKSRRPDRVVWHPDGKVSVIDYKTGEEDLKKHSAQVRRYMDLLRQSGEAEIRGYIWYLDSGKVYQV